MMNEPASVAPESPMPLQNAQNKPAAPIVTYVLIGVTILIYILEMASESFLGTNIPVMLGAKYNPAIMAGQFWRLFTPIFLHGPIFHILLQMFWLFIMGRGLEPLFGKLRFFLLYILSGFVGMVFSFLLTKNTSTDIAYGSGVALFGLISAQVAFLIVNRSVYGERIWDSLRNIGIIIAINIAVSLLPGFDRIAPIGGLLGGLVFAWLAAPKLRPVLVETEQGKFYSLKDMRQSKDVVLAAGLTLLVFGSLAAAKVIGLWPQ